MNIFNHIFYVIFYKLVEVEKWPKEEKCLNFLFKPFFLEGKIPNGRTNIFPPLTNKCAKTKI